MTDMTPKQLMTEIRRLDKERTQGRWKAFLGSCGVTFDVHIKGKLREVIVFWTGFDSSDRPIHERKANAKFISHAPDMVRLIRHQQAVIEMLREGLASIEAGNYPNPRNHRPNGCEHGAAYYDACDRCIDVYIVRTLSRLESDEWMTD